MIIIKEKFEIDGREYSTVKLPVSRAIPLHAYVISSLGPGVTQTLGSIDRNDNARIIGMAIIGALAQANLTQLAGILPEVMGEVFLLDKRLIAKNFEEHFSDYPHDLYPVFGWVLAVNLAPFFAGSAQGWKALSKHLGLKSPKDGEKPGSSPAQ